MRKLLEHLAGLHEAKESPRQKMLDKLGIEAPEKAKASHVACSIGKSKDGKWYGWSHRAVCGFGLGDKIFEPDFGDDDTKYNEHGRKPIRTDADAKQAAINFAAYVS